MANFISIYRVVTCVVVGFGTKHVSPVRMKRGQSHGIRRSLVVGAVLLAGLISSAAASEPELKVVEGKQPAVAGRPWKLVCEVTWEGAPGEYAVAPPDVSPFDWGRAEVRSAKTFVREGKNVVAYEIMITADAPGEYTTPEMNLVYTSPEDIKEAEISRDPDPLPGSEVSPQPGAVPPSLRVHPLTLQVSPDRSKTWMYAVLGALLLSLLALAGARLLRRPKEIQASTTADVAQQVANTLLEAKRQRVEGAYYECCRSLAGAARLAGDESLAGALQARADDIGYRGTQPSKDELDGYFRKMEQTLKKE